MLTVRYSMKNGGSGMETFLPEKLPQIVEKYYKRRWEMIGKTDDGYVFAQVWKDPDAWPKWNYFYDGDFAEKA